MLPLQLLVMCVRAWWLATAGHWRLGAHTLGCCACSFSASFLSG